jgi:hypothetical protein
MISRNHTGHRIGESHHRSRLSDSQVKEIRNLREMNKKVYSYKKLSIIYGCGETTIRDIVQFRTRWNA